MPQGRLPAFNQQFRTVAILLQVFGWLTVQKSTDSGELHGYDEENLMVLVKEEKYSRSDWL